MKMNKNQLKSLLISSDFIIALVLSIVVLILNPEKIKLGIAKEIFEVAIAVLSIVFSVYFAALAVVITSGDNEFIKFLEKDGSYSHIIWTLKITLLLLFFALIVSIFFICYCAPN